MDLEMKLEIPPLWVSFRFLEAVRKEFRAQVKIDLNRHPT